MKIANDFKYVFQMQLFRSIGPLMFFTVIQIFMSLGIIVGFRYLFDDLDNQSLLYLATGAPTFILVLTGLVILPMQIGNAKIEGYVEFTRTWPVNRGVIIGADTSIWLGVTIPGLCIATLFAHLMFSPGYDISWTVIPALLLIALTSIGVGYGFSYLFPQDVTFAVSQFIAFGALMFSPLNFPIERLPEWFQAVHHILPFHSMAEVMRASLAASTFEASVWNYVTLCVWCVVGYGGAIWILNRK
ncbi:ABC transporter permease [Paenibacillus dendritiformis]|uniref:ABC transporter permease n=1 Tax=Paenibacillus dendritiformis TaxID=130049 RepID=UPI00364AF643